MAVPRPAVVQDSGGGRGSLRRQEETRLEPLLLCPIEKMAGERGQMPRPESGILNVEVLKHLPSNDSRNLMREQGYNGAIGVVVPFRRAGGFDGCRGEIRSRRLGDLGWDIMRFWYARCGTTWSRPSSG